MPVQEETIVLTASDGFTLDAFVARADGRKKGGLVVLQEIFGVTDQLKSVARAYAADGYDTIVPALFDRVSPDTVVPFSEPAQGRELAMSLDLDKAALDVAAARDAVDTGNGVSLIGFCWGGGQALRLACNLDFACAIAYYGTALDKHMAACPDGPGCPMLFHFGESDDHTPPHIVDAVRQAIPAAEIEIYEAGHAFANDARPPVFNEAAATLARQRTLAFLNRNHGA